MTGIGLNGGALRIAGEMVEAAESLRIAESQGQGGERLIDAGAAVRGSIEAGLRMAEAAMGGLGSVAGGWVAGWLLLRGHPLARARGGTLVVGGLLCLSSLGVAYAGSATVAAPIGAPSRSSRTRLVSASGSIATIWKRNPQEPDSRSLHPSVLLIPPWCEAARSSPVGDHDRLSGAATATAPTRAPVSVSTLITWLPK